MIRNRKWIGVVIIFLLSLGRLVYAEEAPSDIGKIKTQIQHAAMFKNGLGVVWMKAQLPSSAEGIYQVSPVPRATFGSFWIVSPEGSQVTDVKLTKTRSQEKVPAATLVEMLEANVGKVVDLLVGETWQRVTVKEIPKRHDGPVLKVYEDEIVPPPPPKEHGDVLIVQEEEGIRVIPLSSIKEIRLDSSGSGYELEIPKDEEVMQFKISFDNPESKEKPDVYLIAMVKGIAWAPSYVIDISDEKNAVVTGKAVIINDLATMENTEVELITGVPNISFENVDSAFSLNPLSQIIQQLSGGRPSETRRRGVMTQAVTSNRFMMDAGVGISPSVPSIPVGGEQSEDLFFYQLDPISLKKGERAYQALFAQTTPYEHIYTWDISNQMDDYDRFRGGDQESQEIVWHSIKITNPTDQPWTTAPAITMKGNRVLGQETLYYTPPKASTEVKITQAASIKAEQNEYEVERRRNAARFYATNFDLVTVKGVLEIVNYKSESVKLKITKNFSGDLVESKPKAEIQAKANKLNQVNPAKQLIWNIELQPGIDGKTTLEYTYNAYVRG